MKKRRKKLKHADFKVGQIIKMDVGPRSHVKVPYHVEVLTVGVDSIETGIPGEHTLHIRPDNNWDYHIPRMTIIGDKKEHGHLLLNQKGLV